MITQAILNWFAVRLQDLAALISQPIEGFGAITRGLADGMVLAANAVAITDPIIPTASIATALGIGLTGVAAVIGIWLTRVIISLFTGGGGDV